MSSHRAAPGVSFGGAPTEEMRMRNLFLAALVAVTLMGAGGAFAQSQQGGYLGINNGAQAKALPPAEEAAAEAKMEPRAWCKSSTEPSRCWANAEREHASCMSTSPDHYEACRFALDKMHN
jgi:hypothetical protein